MGDQLPAEALKLIIRSEIARALYGIAEETSRDTRYEYDSVKSTALSTTETYLRNAAQRLWDEAVQAEGHCIRCGHDHRDNGPQNECSAKLPRTDGRQGIWCRCPEFTYRTVPDENPFTSPEPDGLAALLTSPLEPKDPFASDADLRPTRKEVADAEATYSYGDVPGDVMVVADDILSRARQYGIRLN